MKKLLNQNGLSYILALTLVVIMGIMLGMVGQTWKSIKQRELEEEMIFRGDQVAEVVYQRLDCKNANMSPGTVNQFLWPTTGLNGTILDELIAGKEERCMNGRTRKFRLRNSAVLDPITNKQWFLSTPIADTMHFSGVKSESAEAPFRKDFSELYDTTILNNKQKYSDWEFTWELKTPVAVVPVIKKP